MARKKEEKEKRKRLGRRSKSPQKPHHCLGKQRPMAQAKLIIVVNRCMPATSTTSRRRRDILMEI